MKILIIGLGYAGTRFLHAFQSTNRDDVTAYVGRTHRRTDVPYFSDVPTALSEFKPQLVILCVNDVYRADVGRHLAGYEGFVLCEKPFVCPSDDLAAMAGHFADTSGFCLDLVERYAPTSMSLRDFVRREGLKLVRANFTWGKDRLGDHRLERVVISRIPLGAGF